MKHKNKRIGKKGLSILLAVLILSVILTISTGISLILIRQTKMIGSIGYSVIAFYAADTGIEQILYDESQGVDIVTDCPESSPCQGDLLGLGVDASFSVGVIEAGEAGCPSPPAQNYCIKSVGIYKEIRRAIQVTR